MLILFVVSSIGIWRMGSEFLPATDSHQISMQVELPHELSASDAAAVIDQITAVLEGIEDIETIGVTSVGSMLGMPMSMGGSGSNSYSFYLLLNEQRSLSSRQIAQQIRDLTEGINADITVADTGFDISMIAGEQLSSMFSVRISIHCSPLPKTQLPSWQMFREQLKYQTAWKIPRLNCGSWLISRKALPKVLR